MQINENYNTSLGKYGKQLTKEMENSGISPNYLGNDIDVLPSLNTSLKLV